MPQDACHAKSSTKLLKLNNRIVLAQIVYGKRDDAEHLDSIALDRLTVHGDERATVNFHDSRKDLCLIPTNTGTVSRH